MKKVTIALVLVIGIVTLLLISNRQTTRTWPSMSSASPSGFAAFAELLRHDGYKVTLNRTARLKRAKADLVIIPAVAFKDSKAKEASVFSGGEEDKFETSLMKYIEEGGQVLSIELPDDFDKATKSVIDTEVTTFSRGLKNLVVTLPDNFDDSDTDSALPFIGNTSASIWFDQDSEFDIVRQILYEEKSVTHVLPGIIASNRMIARRDNAKLLLHTVHGLAKPGSNIVIAEALFNRQDENVFSILGRWASFAWWQILLVAATILFSLSRRFGHPVTDRRVQRGARDLVDAIAESTRMARKGNFALTMSVYDAEKRIRSVLRLPRSSKPEVYMHQAGERVHRAWQTASIIALTPKPKEKEALHAVQQLEEAVASFEKDRRSSRPNLTHNGKS